MGAVLAKFRKEKSPADVLEKLETDIRAIEKFSVSTQAKQKRLVGNFLVISIGLYTLGFLIFYFVFFPPTWSERITYSIPLLIFPLLIFLLRRLLAWYFQRKINKNSTKLVTLRAEKKRILEEVMEKETYNVASKLLSKYGDKSYGIKALSVTAPTPLPNRQQPDNRIQNLNSSLIAPQTQQVSQMAPNRSVLTANNGQSMNSPNTPRSSYFANTSGALRHRVTQNQHAITPAVKRPFPIINQKTQGMLDKMVDYLIGDGPQNRYALICKACFAHNGMAREEEFDYATFRCAFCNALNPSRKLRPVAPKLSTTMASPLNTRINANTDSDSPSDSGDDSDTPRQGEKSTLLPTKESEKSVDSEAASDIKEVNPTSNGDESAESEETKPSIGAQSEEQKSDDKNEEMPAKEEKDEKSVVEESQTIIYNNLF